MKTKVPLIDRLVYARTLAAGKKVLDIGGWKIERMYYTFGKWSFISRCINAIGSLMPSLVGTGLMIHCKRK